MRARRLLFGCALLLLPPLATSLRRLTSLRTGERLRGVVVGEHRDKLFIDVGVVRAARESEMESVKAILKLSPAHPIRSQRLTSGRALDVYVSKVQTASGRLRVGLRPPSAETHAPPDERREAGDVAGDVAGGVAGDGAGDVAGEVAGDAPRRARHDAAAAGLARPLESLELGETLEGRIVSRHRFGLFVDVGVCRGSKGGKRVPLDGLLPLDQLGQLDERALSKGEALRVRVLESSKSSGQHLPPPLSPPLPSLYHSPYPPAAPPPPSPPLYHSPHPADPHLYLTPAAPPPLPLTPTPLPVPP